MQLTGICSPSGITAAAGIGDHKWSPTLNGDGKAIIAAIGPTTGDALTRCGWLPTAIASTPTPVALFTAINSKLNNNTSTINGTPTSESKSMETSSTNDGPPPPPPMDSSTLTSMRPISSAIRVAAKPSSSMRDEESLNFSAAFPGAHVFGCRRPGYPKQYVC
jgi:hypothetical protein